MSEATKFENLLEAVPEALVGICPSGDIWFVNHQTEVLFGYERDDLVGRRIETLVPEALQHVSSTPTEDSFASPGSRTLRPDLELTARNHDGVAFQVNVSLSKVETGDVLLEIEPVSDVTRRERAFETAQRMTAIVENCDDAIIGKTLNGTITSWNPAAERMYGYSGREAIGRSIHMLAPADRVHEINTILDRIASGETVDNFLTDRRRRDGTLIPVSITVSPIRREDGAVVGASTVARDMSEAMRSFEDLQKMGAVVQHSNDAIIGKTIEGVVTNWNPAAERMYGYSAKEIIGRSINVLTRGRAEEIEAILHTVRSGKPVENFETIRVRKDGTQIWVSLSVSPICSADGTVVGAATIARDMTEARTASELARAMLESSHDSLVSISEEGMIIDANEATVKATGVSRDELIGTPFSGYFTEPDKAGEAYGQAFAQGTEAGAEDHALCIRHRDGKLTDVMYHASVYRGTCGQVLAVFAAARDVTKLAEAAKAARTMMESSLDSLVSISPEGKLTDVNKATVKVTGVPRDELIGTAFSEYFTNPASANRIYKLVFEEGTARDYPLSICHRDGSLTDVLYNASLHRDSDGRVLGVFAAARDVTKQMHAQKAYECQQAKERQKIVELERFQRLMVGRELMMAQLKREMAVLQEENRRLRGPTPPPAPL